MLTELECKRALHDLVYNKLTAAMKDFDRTKAIHEQTIAGGQRARDHRGDAVCALSLALGFEHEQSNKEAATAKSVREAGRDVKVWNEVFKFLLDNIVGREFNFKMTPVPSD